MELQDVHKKILVLCAGDDTGFWLIMQTVARDVHSFDKLPDWVRPKTLETIRYLLETALIEAGNFELEATGGFRFQPMSLPIDEII